MKINQSVRRHINAADSRPHPNRPAPDFSIYGSGTVYLFQPLTDRAREWLKVHCPPDSEHQYLGDSLAVEHRYISEIRELAVRDELIPQAETLAEGSVK